MPINVAFLFTHHIMMAITVGTGISIVGAGITVGVIIAKQDVSFQNHKIVLQSPATIVLNRFLEAYELPLYFDAVETMTLFLEYIKKILKEKFGDSFVNIELLSFSPTPTISSKDSTKSLSKNKDEFTNRLSDADSSSNFETSTTQDNTFYTTDIPSKNYSILVSILNCTNTNLNNNNNNCTNETRLVNCSVTTCNISEIWKCVHKTIQIHDCTHPKDNTIICSNATITIPNDYCTENKPSTTVTTTKTTTTTSTSKNNCEVPQNAAGQSSIIFSKVSISFAVKPTESILVADIIATLKNLKPPIAVYTVCEKSSSQTSSFNSTLSKVEPPTKVDIDLSAITGQASISDSLKATVSSEANAAKEQLLPSSSTPSPG